jgi:hypothetical protein
MGAALLTKFSAVLLLPILGAVYWFRWWQEAGLYKSPDLPRLSWTHFYKSLSAIAIITIPMIWAVYAFETRKLATDTQVAKFLNAPEHVARIPGVLGKWLSSSTFADASVTIANRVPIPAYSFWKGFYKAFILRRESYLLGKWYETGSLHYFLVAIAVKTPLATLIMLVFVILIGFWLLFRRSSPATWRAIRSMPFQAAALIIPVLVYFSASSLSRINIGIRHILPIYPFLFVLVAAVLFHYEIIGDAVMKIRKMSIVLAVLLMLESLTVYPHYLAFFNLAAGGPGNGPHYLIDSNVDWGQDLKKLGKYVAEQHINNLCLSYFGWAPPGYYGISYRAVDSFETAKALSGCVYAVSVNSLYSPRFADLRRFQPDAKVGYSIYVYKLPKIIGAHATH